jgi:hypothetical protein
MAPLVREIARPVDGGEEPHNNPTPAWKGGEPQRAGRFQQTTASTVIVELRDYVSMEDDPRCT